MPRISAGKMSWTGTELQAMTRQQSETWLRVQKQRQEMIERYHAGAMTPADWRLWPAEWHVPKAKRPICGAKTRSGAPYKRRAAEGHWRCPNHGGLSTGPNSAEGRAKIAASNRSRAAAWIV